MGANNDLTSNHSDRQVPDKQGPGAAGFSLDYWETNYAQPETMDGIYNSRGRALALKALLDSEYFEVATLVDLGFGLGALFKEMINVFMPHIVIGLEPSPYAYNRLQQVMQNMELTDIESIQIQLLRMDISQWCQQESQPAEFDLGICTSVFQYLSDAEIQASLPIMAERIRYLYFSVPTDLELLFQREELQFHDPYAISRSKAVYHAMIQDHFTIVSNRVLESKRHFSANTSYFTDFLYRF
ncbi:MAG: class I SAM-dependent methyltransferase [Chloroflexota bacterium]